MTQYAIKDYVSLITKLLQCPRGEEWALFHRYQYLINPEMAQVLKQIAQNFSRQGDSKTANLLYQWATEIQQHLEQEALQKPEPFDQDYYDELIQLLLDSPEGYEPTILSQQQALVDQTLIDRMGKVARTMAINGDVEQAQYLSDLATQINQNLNSDLLQDELALESKTIHQDHTNLSREFLDIGNLSAVQSTPSPSEVFEQTSDITASNQLISLLQSLNTLAIAIADQTSSVSDFAYLDILEKAQAHEWLLTTNELQSILGTKPYCSASNPEYHHGGWRFVKCGRVGRNALWQIFKLRPLEIISAEDKSKVETDSSLPFPVQEADPWIA